MTKSNTEFPKGQNTECRTTVTKTKVASPITTKQFRELADKVDQLLACAERIEENQKSRLSWLKTTASGIKKVVVGTLYGIGVCARAVVTAYHKAAQLIRSGFTKPTAAE
jgi:hypothetical protein